MWDHSNPICKKIAVRLAAEEKDPRGAFAEPIGNVQRSRECACAVCNVVCRMLDESEKKLGPGVGVRVGYAKNSVEEDKVEVNFNRSGIEVGGLEGFVTDSHPITAIPVSTSISGDTDSEKSFQRVIEWLNNCLTNHNTLCPTFGLVLNPLPARVLDLGPFPDGNGKDDVRLLQTSTEIGYYACLSHCWGTGTRPLETTRDTFSLHEVGIELAALPKTFQEAVTFTRRLSIRYLWIDSLCIIQDDNDDWRVQSALMAEIYQNALLTIAASASAGPEMGLFRTVGVERQYLDWELSVEEKEAKEKEHSTNGIFQNIRIRVPLPHDVNQHPLLTRAWAFQERLLSPRILHFGAHELIWECMECTTCECQGLGKIWSKRHRQWPAPKNRVSNAFLSPVGREWAVEAWQNTVSSYSCLKLSYTKDIFPALSGIARNIALVTGQQYVAGLWKDSLVLDLVWNNENPRKMERPVIWRAPTFSWASVTAKKDVDGVGASYAVMDVIGKSFGARAVLTQTVWKGTQHVEVVETQSTLLSPSDSLGQITAGYIVLSGFLVQATVCAADDATDCAADDASPASSSEDIAPIGKMPLDEGSFWPDYDYTVEGKDHISLGSTVFCLKLISAWKPQDRNVYVVYLTLRRIGDASGKGSVYERIGLYTESGEFDESLEMESEEDAICENAVVKII
ncbi:HET-domain-containing protein [Melanomma pulvis-pyrius CBS 109.77]|uniref:HET-domain-containing protein n=1 Tax=Melanomma pulvis-pyrius CBS 109.77 TaxID=1314802 RepID=A0A6A6WT12_9PLEO|nr:HET-domain-containing protein [Melanomma pulvis-pyrius CBS 109.77]